MAENNTELTSEQLLMQLGKVVLGLGNKLDILAMKMDSIHLVLAQDIAPALKDVKSTDLTPVIEKLDAIATPAGSTDSTEELKLFLDGLSSSFDQLPSRMIERLKELKDSDSSKPMEALEKQLTQVKEQLEASEVQILTAVKVVPDKIDNLGDTITESMKTLSETTGTMLAETEKNAKRSDESLEEIKTELDKGLKQNADITDTSLRTIKSELEKGLKLNTDMTDQMVTLTTRFADNIKEDRVGDLNTRAISHFNRSEYPQAKILLDEALEMSPKNSELLCNAAHLMAAMDDADEAEKLFRRALEISPDLEPAISGLGMLMVKTDRAEETIEFLKNAISDTDMSVRTVIALARAQAAVGKHSEAVELLESSFRSSPDNPALKDELARYGHEEKK